MKKNKKEEKKGRSVLSRAIISLIVALVVVIYMNIPAKRSLTSELGLLGLVGWSWTVFCLAIFFASFAFAFVLFTIKINKKDRPVIEYTEQELRQQKRKKFTIIFLIISMIATGLYVSYNYEQLAAWGLGKSIPAVALFFGLVFMAFELFSFIKPSIFEGLVRLPWNILMKVLVPMMPFWIILLGIMQAWYPTNYPFLDETTRNLRSAFFTAASAFQKVIAQLYNLGLERPSLWFALIIGAFIILLYFVVKEIFVEKEKDEDDISADELIKKAVEEAKEKEERKLELKKNWYEKLTELFSSKEEREKEEQEELADMKANSHVKIVRLHE